MSRQPAVPQALTTRATTSVGPNSRYWPDIDAKTFVQSGLRTMNGDPLLGGGDGSPVNMLALSGGGDAGAFGAGLLVGWSSEGTRPEFKVVTGVSAGALIAPFAFLGAQYDRVLDSVCNLIGPNDIFHTHNVLAAFTGDAVADDRPLESLIAKYVTPSVLSAIAREYAKGRLLLIGTTNLDARQRVIWNMGAIASSDDPHALRLFQQIILASTSIPGVFPPVMIDVEVDGKRYQEMHVDGGVMNQAFMFPPFLLDGRGASPTLDDRERHIYVIRNGYLASRWVAVPRRTTKVARRAFDSLIEAQGINDLYRLQLAARYDHEQFHFAFIGAEFQYPHSREFDAKYIQHLFAYGYHLGASGYQWQKDLLGVDRSSADARNDLSMVSVR